MKDIETDDQIIERLRVRFECLEDMTRAVKGGKVRSMIVSGSPGVGKSFGIEKVLGYHDLFATIANDQSLKKYEIVKGAMSPLGLYVKLHQFKNDKNVLVIDDCDNIYSDEQSLNLLKTCLDTGKKRVVSWNYDSYKLKDEGVPNSFEFNGGIIFITNVDFDHVKSRKIKSHLEALESRCHFINLTCHSNREKLLRIRQIVNDGMLDGHGIDNEKKLDVVDFICDNHTALRELSLRTVIKAADLASSFPDRWKDVAKITLMKSR